MYILVIPRRTCRISLDIHLSNTEMETCDKEEEKEVDE
jgi:hypothetical protein